MLGEKYAAFKNWKKQISVKGNRLKNPNWREADQLDIERHDQGVDLGSTEKQLQLSNRAGLES